MPADFAPPKPCLLWRLTTLSPSTVARPALGNTALTVPRFPFSLPRRIMTMSPLTIFVFSAPGRATRTIAILEHLRRERGDLQETTVAQLAADRTEDARAARIEIVFFTLDDDARVLVEL